MSSEAAYFPDAVSNAEAKHGGVGTTDVPSESRTDTELCCASSDEELLSQIGRGSKEDLGFLFRRHRRTILNVARRILRDDSEAEDLCQEVFLFLFKNAKSFDAEKGTALSWIIQIAYHRAMNRRQYLTFRQHYTVEELNEEQIDTGRHHLFIDELAARTLLNRLREKLSREQQQALELHFFEGYSLREIAEKTNQTLGNTRNHFYRGLDRLRSCVLPQKDV